MVRIEKFNAEEDDTDAPMSKRASVKAMQEWMKEDEHYREQQTEERYNLDGYFNDDDVKYNDDDDEDDLIGGTTVQRVAFTQAMVYDEAFGFHGKLPNNAQADSRE